MNHAQLAGSYLRYWYFDSAGRPHLADNAPTPLYRFVAGQPNRELAYRVLRTIAERKGVEPPKLPELCRELAASPSLQKAVNTLLTKKKGPTTLQSLLEDAYRVEFLDVSTAAHKFLADQLENN